MRATHAIHAIPVLAVLALLAACRPAPADPNDPETVSSSGAETPAEVPDPAAVATAPADDAAALDEVAGEAEGQYTSLEARDCTLVTRYEESGGGVWRCPGIAGYTLDMRESDGRMSVDVHAPDGTVAPLQLSSIVGRGAFSTLGTRAEWRDDENGKPSALILRFAVQEDPDRPAHATSYLVVSRLAPAPVCAIERIAPGPGQNLRARVLADDVAGKPCMEGPGG